MAEPFGAGFLQDKRFQVSIDEHIEFLNRVNYPTYYRWPKQLRSNFLKKDPKFLKLS